jgi:hypothetical protein
LDPELDPDPIVEVRSVPAPKCHGSPTPEKSSVIVCTDKDLFPDPSFNKQINKKNFGFYCVVTS